MQVSGINNVSNTYYKPFGTQHNADYTRAQNYTPIALNTSKAYASAQITEGYRELTDFEIPYIGKGRSYELSNGHKIIILPKAGKTHISTIVGCGFNNEPANKKGVAHLCEHLLANSHFKAAQNSDTAKILRETNSDINAFTSDSFSRYYISSNVQTPDELENLLDIQYKTLTNNKFLQDDLSKEKDILKEEYKITNLCNKPEHIAFDYTIKNLFAPQKQISPHTIDGLQAITKEDLSDFYNEFYYPANMITVVIGNVDKNTIKTISKKFNQSPSCPGCKTTSLEDFNSANSFKRTDITIPDIYYELTNLSFAGPKMKDRQDIIKLSLANKLVENRLAAKNIQVNADILSFSLDPNAPQLISLKHKNSYPNSKIPDKILDEIKLLTTSRISKNELEKAKEQLLNDLADTFETNKELSLFLAENLLSNSLNNTGKIIGYVNSISEKDLQETVQKYYNLDKCSLLTITPSKTPSFKGSSDTGIKSYELNNNLKVIFDTRARIVKTTISGQFLFENKEDKNKGLIETINKNLIRSNSTPDFEVNTNGIFIEKNDFGKDLKTSINNIIQELSNPKFNVFLQKQQAGNLKSAAEKLFEDRISYPNQNDIRPKWLNTTHLSDYYKTLLRNSQGTIIITTPHLENEKEIIKLLENITPLRKNDFVNILKSSAPKDIESSEIILEKHQNSDKITIDKNYKIITQGSLKEEMGMFIIAQILNEKLKQTLRNDLSLAYFSDVTYETASPKHGIFSIFIAASNNSAHTKAKQLLSELNKAVENITSSTTDSAYLNSIKKQIKSKLLFPDESSLKRNTSLGKACEYKNDADYPKSLLAELEEITPDYITSLAQKYLSKNFILKIYLSEEEARENLDFLKALGAINVQAS